MRNRSRIGAVLCVCIVLPSLLLACGSTEPVPTAPAPTTTTGTEPTTEASPTTEAPTEAPATQASPTEALATDTPPTQAPATQAPATQAPAATVTSLPTPEPGAEPAYDDQDSPAALLASYVNAINRQEYERAWEYWESPPNPTFEDFQAGFADTESVLLAVRPPAWFGAAAGSVYAPIGTLLLTTHTDASQENFLGCYIARRQNVDPGGDSRWWLYDATVNPAPDDSSAAIMLVDACEQVPPPGSTEPEYDDQGSPVAILASYINAINRREYERAWEYWDSPPNPTFEDFQEGFAGTDEAFLVVSPPTIYEGAAGSVYTSVPAVLMATQSASGRQAFVGCYVLRRSNVDDTPPEWHLYDATISELSTGSPGVDLLAGACPAP